MRSFKKICLLLLVLVVCGFISDNKIYPEKIDWDTHFRASPDVNSNYAAVTSTIWNYGYTATIERGNLKIDFSFLAGVVPEKSWVNKNKIQSRNASEKLLNHEQGHVYINFLQLKNGETIIKNQSYTKSNFKTLISKKAKEVSTFYSAMQERYDVETKHGADVEVQKKWDNFFEDQLRQFK